MSDTEQTHASDFAPASIEIARAHIGHLLAAYQGATGFPKTFCAKVARGEPKFADLYQTIDFGFRSYDAVVSRLSAVWPEGTPWPEHIPRQAPAEIPEDLLASIREREDRMGARGEGQSRPEPPAPAA